MIHHLNFKSIYFRGEKYDPKAVKDGIDFLAKYLNKGLKSDSPFIAFTACNHIKTLIVYYAILKIGKVAVVMDPLSKHLEIEEILKDTDPAAVINLDDSIIHFDSAREVVFRKRDSKHSVLSDLTDVCTLAYTNAEDGYSKGAMLTNKNLLSEVNGIIKTNHLTSSSVFCALLPFSHLYGFVHGVLAPSQAGCSSVIPDVNLLQLAGTVNTLKALKVTHLHTDPSIYYLLSKIPNCDDFFSSVENFYSGGIQLSDFVYESFLKKTGRKIREGYGLTEGSPAVAGNFQEEDPVFGSFGKAFPGCEIKILNENNQECKTEEVGEICVRGDMVFKGYFNNESTTRSVLRNEWLYTGDYGRKDKNGYIYFCGLKKNMINIAGNKLYPQKLIRFLKSHPNLHEAQIHTETSVLQGNVINISIKLNDNSKKQQDDFKTWCYSNINNTLLPKSWNFI